MTLTLTEKNILIEGLIKAILNDEPRTLITLPKRDEEKCSTIIAFGYSSELYRNDGRDKSCCYNSKRLPHPQRAGTYGQQRSYAVDKARELVYKDYG